MEHVLIDACLDSTIGKMSIIIGMAAKLKRTNTQFPYSSMHFEAILAMCEKFRIQHTESKTFLLKY